MSYTRSSLGLAAIVFTGAASIFLYRSLAASDAPAVRDLAVSCGAEHRAVVRQAAGQSSVAVDCVPDHGLTLAPGAVVSRAELEAVAASVQTVPRVIPAVYTPEALVETVRPSRVVRASAPAARSSAARRVERKPSWQKRAIVIGGSAGAGAGIGALIGGKKGALIGAAIGGGGAAVVDQVKNR